MSRRPAPETAAGAKADAPGHPAPAARRQRLLTDERRAQILELATRLFAERPYEEVAVDDLAQELGISKGLLYHYYPTKRDLYVAGLRKIADGLLAHTGGVPESSAPLSRLTMALDRYLDFVAEHARPYLSLMRGGIGADPQVSQIVDGCRDAYLALLTQGLPIEVASGTPAQEAARALLLRGWIGCVEAASIAWIADGGPRSLVSRERLREVLANALLAMLQTS